MAVKLILGRDSLKEQICAVEPIRTPGMIQPHGVLLAADPLDGFRLVAASANVVALPGANPDPLSHSLSALLGGAFAERLAKRHRAGMLASAEPFELTVDLPSGETHDVACHAQSGRVIIEIERADPGDAPTALVAARHLQRAIASLRLTEGGLETLAATLVRDIRGLTGFERVLVYRFDEDWNGQAIAEDRTEGWDHSLLHLHFPASDIPSQARALYHVSTMRWVVARDVLPVSMVMAEGETALDLSFARLRSLSPSHMQYQRNLGVDGSMSISIMAGRRLWGLVVCHHREPHRTSAGQRAAAAALTDAFGLRVGPAEHAGQEAARLKVQGRFSTLMAHMAEVDDMQAALTAGPVTVRDLFAVPGAAVVQGDRVTLLGATPPMAEVLRLAAWLRDGAMAPGGVFATATLPGEMPDWNANAVVASGLMAVSLDGGADLLLWFRPEEPVTVTWGGNPIRDTADLGPRASFDRWVEERHGTAQPWAPHEVETATLLRHAITEVINRSLRRITALNEQLRQSQKMEAVGQLTGGLAHDFNNLLAGITGSLELAQVRLAQGRGSELGRYIGAALAATGRAASLTHRLLAFSRQQTLDPRPLDVNRLVASMEELIRRTVGPGITVECVGAAGLWTVLCDGNQLENALLNLAINARDAMRGDAMKGGGRLTIEAANTRLDDAYAGQYDVPPGQYVAVSVSDTGEGMTADTAARVFEPFFTTKPMGQGTGLGLSMVYGFAKQSGGHARIYSEVGHGTTVRLYLPRHHGPAAWDLPPSPDALLTLPGRLATILVVDDEPVLRMLVCEVLTEQGYAVLEAADADRAMETVSSVAPIDLLLTDIGLPGAMNGRQLLEAARVARPGLKVLFMTGFAETAALAGGVLDPVTQVMTKPFGMGTLVGKVRGMLG